jgi:hypothetical protein
MSRRTGVTVALAAWAEDEFGVLVDYGDGTWRKYRVGTREQASAEAKRAYQAIRCLLDKSAIQL